MWSLNTALVLSWLYQFYFPLHQIGRIVSHPEAVTEILNNDDLLQEVVHCIGGDHIAVAQQVTVLNDHHLLAALWDSVQKHRVDLYSLCFSCRPFPPCPN